MVIEFSKRVIVLCIHAIFIW